MIILFLRLIVFCFVFISAIAEAEPHIDSVSGDIIKSSSITINGSSFGSDISTNRISWTKHNQENALDEEIAFTGKNASTGWTAWLDSASNIAPRYDTQEKHSGNNSIRSNWYGNAYNSHFNYSLGTSITSVFSSAWIKFSPKQGSPDCAAQWKRFYVSEKQGAGSEKDGFVGGSWYYWGTPNGPGFGNNCSLFLWGGGSSGCIRSPYYKPSLDTWIRWEHNVKKSSIVGTPGDGKYEIDVYDASGRHVWNEASNCQTHILSSNDWKYVNMGSYYGNVQGVDCGIRDANAWWDDIYVSINNGSAHVIICAESQWELRNNCEIQYPTSWAEPSINITLNQGAFSDGQNVYLYVVNSIGEANITGYPITIGSAIQTPKKPNAPTGLHSVQK